MPDLTAQANELKQTPDQALQQELQHPSGAVPPFLTMSEVQRRQLTRQAAQAQQSQGQSGSVYDDIVRSMMARQPLQGLPAAPAGMVPMASASPSALGVTPPQNFQAPRMMADGGLYDDEGDDDEFSAADPFLDPSADPFLQSPQGQAQGIAAIGAPQGFEGATEAPDNSVPVPEGFEGATEMSDQDFQKELVLKGLKGHGGRKGGHGGKRGGKRKGEEDESGGGGGGKGGFKLSKILSAVGKMGASSHGIGRAATIHPPHFSYMHPMQQHHAQGFHFAEGGALHFAGGGWVPGPSDKPGYTRWYTHDASGNPTYKDLPQGHVPTAGTVRMPRSGSGRAAAAPKPHYQHQKEMGDPTAGKDIYGRDLDPDKLYYHEYWISPDGTTTGDKWRPAPQEMGGRSLQANLEDLNKWMKKGAHVYSGGKEITPEDLNSMGLSQFSYRATKDGRHIEIYPLELPTTQGWTLGQDQYGNPVPVWKGTTTKALPGAPQAVPQVVPGMEPQGGAQPALSGVQPAQSGMPGQGAPQAPAGAPPQQQPMQQPMPGGPQQQPQAQYSRPREYDEGSGMPAARMSEQQYSIFSRRQAKAEPIRTAFTQMFGDRTDPGSTGGYLGVARYLDNPKYPDYATHVGRALEAVLKEGQQQVGGLGMSAGGEGFNINFGGIGDMFANYFKLPIAQANQVQKVAEEQLSHLTPEEQEGFNYGLAALSVSPGIRTITAGAATNQQFNSTAREVPLIGVNAFTRGGFVKRMTNLSQEFRNAAQFTINAGVPRYITNDMLDAPERVRNLEAGKTMTQGTVDEAARQWGIHPEDVAKDVDATGIQIIPGPANEQGLQRPRQTQQQIQAQELPGRADWFRENVAPQTNPPRMRLLRPEEVKSLHQWGLDEQGNPLTPEQIAALPPEEQPGGLRTPQADWGPWATGPLPSTGSWWRDILGLPRAQAPAAQPKPTLPAGVLPKPQPQTQPPAGSIAPPAATPQLQPAPTPAPTTATPTAPPAATPAAAPLSDDEIVKRYEEIQRRRAEEQRRAEEKAQPAAPPPAAPAPAPSLAPQQAAPSSSDDKWTGPLPWEQPQQQARGGQIFDRAPTRGETLRALTRR